MKEILNQTQCKICLKIRQVDQSLSTKKAKPSLLCFEWQVAWTTLYFEKYIQYYIPVKWNLIVQHAISPDSCVSSTQGGRFMMKKQHDNSGKDSHEETASNCFCLGVVHIPGLWHSLHPLSNNGSSVAVARPVGQAVHFTLWLLFTWKKRSMRSGSSHGGETTTLKNAQM